jgi:phosphoglycolate phosphatase
VTSRPLLRPPRAVLFDWDNTLIDSWLTIQEAMNATLRAMGHPEWSLEETRARVRRSAREAFPVLFGNRWEEARTIFYARFRAIHLELLRTCEGAGELLRYLDERGVYLGVVSNKAGEHLRREAAHLGWHRYFRSLVGATDAARDKPAVEPVDMALAGSGIPRGDTVWFVGDTSIDLECAHNAGVVPILVREAAPRPGEFGTNSPTAHFHTCSGLAALVRTF